MNNPASVVRHSITVTSVVAVFYIAWQIREVFLVAFGGIVVAGVILALSEGIAQVVRLPRKASVGVAVLIILIVFSGLFWWQGEQFMKQLDQLWTLLPQALGSFQDWLEQFRLGERLLSKYQHTNPFDWVSWGRMAGYTTATISGLGTALLIIVLGVYFAASPGVYTRGVVLLTPPVYRDRTETVLNQAGKGLRQWLLGQLISMLIIGVLTGVGLMLLGLPLAFSLGILAGLTAFIPMIGPIGFGVLATVMAFSESPTAALQVAILVLAIQLLESNVILPLIQKEAVSLPPALVLISFLVFGLLFGILGIIFAVPLMVAVKILVKLLYVEGALQKEAYSQIS